MNEHIARTDQVQNPFTSLVKFVAVDEGIEAVDVDINVLKASGFDHVVFGSCLGHIPQKQSAIGFPRAWLAAIVNFRLRIKKAKPPD